MSVIKNPIKLAKLVKEKTNHCYLIGESAEIMAAKHGLEIVPPTYFNTETKLNLLRNVIRNQCKPVEEQESSYKDSNSEFNAKTGTVGAVCQYKGSLAAATSTGGMTNKLQGRIGDCPVIGAGTYANNQTCAVSCTGVGEIFINHSAASSVSDRMRYAGLSVDRAVQETVHADLPRESGGVIAVDMRGDYSMAYNTVGMYRGMCRSDGSGCVAIWDQQHDLQLL